MIFLLSFFMLMVADANSPNAMGYPSLESAHYGVLVKELSGDRYIKSYQENKSFTPASVMKLVTTATALETLGAEFRYMTKLEYRGEIKEGILNGDVIIRGDGDPTLGSAYFYDSPCEFLDVWVRELQVLGVDSIAGSIISDASVFDKQVVPDKWIWEDIGNYYGAGIYGLSCFDNRYSLYFGKTDIDVVAPIDSVVPRCQHLQFDSHVVGANNNRDNAYIYGSPWGFEKQIYGTIPAGRKAFEIKGSLPNPPLVLADLLQQRLEAKGIGVARASEVLWEYAGSLRTGISIWFSPRLGDIVRVTNKESNNMLAEHLLKSTVMFGAGQASLSVAIDSMMALWAAYGLNTEGVKVYDGSGMSRASLLTPEFVVGLIDYMAGSVHRDAFLSSLAIAGVDGTFKYFLDGTDLHAKVLGKSGSMSSVRCYAGIINLSPEEQYSFCIMVNNFTASSAEVRTAIEAYLCDLLVK